MPVAPPYAYKVNLVLLPLYTIVQFTVIYGCGPLIHVPYAKEDSTYYINLLLMLLAGHLYLEIHLLLSVLLHY